MLKKIEVETIISEWKKKHKIRMYTPFKYFKGLTTASSVKKRLTEMNKNRHKTDVSKIKFTTDKEKKTVKKSKYHLAFEERFQISSSSSLEKKSKVTGVPLPILKKVFQKGVAAWKTGHRVGTTAVQWGNARVSSFLTLGCTVFSSDGYLYDQVKALPKTKARTKYLTQPPTCPKYKRKNKIL